MADRLEVLRAKYDIYRRAILCEPRGSDVLVGALLLEPVDPAAAAGVIFFNNAGYLGMCGHGMIGVAATLAYLGRIGVGEHLLETPVGECGVYARRERRSDGRQRGRLSLSRSCAGRSAGLRNRARRRGLGRELVLPDRGASLRSASRQCGRTDGVHLEGSAGAAGSGITGADGAEIDHIELFSPPTDPGNHSRNFVLCPGKAYDRSPCGTGTSAKMACLAAAGKLAPATCGGRKEFWARCLREVFSARAIASFRSFAARLT